MRRVFLLVLAALAVVHAASFVGSGPFDDDFICYRYARNWVEGHGLVFNPGERFEGFTNPLWVLILAAGIRLGLDPEALSLALSMTALGVATWAIGRAWWARNPQASLPFPALLLAASPALAWHGVAGLGTTLMAALLSLWFLEWDRARRADRPAWAASVWLALACLLRQEAAIFAIAFLSSEKRACRWVPLVPLVGWTAFRLAYYGRWLPITYGAKKLPFIADLQYGIDYLLLSTLEAGVGLVLILSVYAQRWVRSHTDVTSPVLTGFLAYAGFVVFAGGDFVAYARFFVPILPIGYLLAAEGARALVPARGGRIVLGALALGAVSWTQQGAIVPIGRVELGIGRPYRFADADWNEGRWRAMGEHLGRTLPPDTSVALSPVGVFGWTSRLPIVDPLGLTNDSVLDEEPMLETVAMKGHHRIDPDWILSRRPALVIPGNGHRDPLNGKPSVNPWEAPLFFHPGFQEAYEHWIVPMPVGEELDVWVLEGTSVPDGWRAVGG